MPEPLAHDLRVGASGEQLRRVCVPEVVEPGPRKLELLDVVLSHDYPPAVRLTAG